MIANADRVVDRGPSGGGDADRIAAIGTPGTAGSVTGRYILT